MGFEIAHGRDFFEGEQGAAIIVDPKFARTLWPGADAVGRMVKFGARSTPGRWYTVVGVRKPVGVESVESPEAGIGVGIRLPTPDDRVSGERTVHQELSGRVVFAKTGDGARRARESQRAANADRSRAPR